MLEGLEEINWSEFEHAYGAATDLPNLLIKLTSQNEKVWQAAFSSLTNKIYHQGTIYPATGITVPFLIQLIAIQSVKDKGAIIDLLRDIALDEAFQAGEAFLAVRESLPLILRLLDDIEPDTRSAVISILTSGIVPTNRTEEVAHILEQHLEVEPDEKVKAATVFGLGSFLTKDRDFLETRIGYYRELFQSLENASSPVVAATASVILAHLFREQTTNTTVQRLIQIAQSEKNKISQELRLWAPNVGDLATTARWAIGYLDMPRAIEAFIYLLNHPDTNTRLVAFSLLTRAFNEVRTGDAKLALTDKGKVVLKVSAWHHGGQDRIEDINEYQRRALEAVLDKDVLWEKPNKLFRPLGFIISRDELREYLKQHP